LPIATWTTEQCWSYLREYYPDIYDWLKHEFYIGGYNPSNCIVCPNHATAQLKALCKLGLREHLIKVLTRCLEREKTLRVRKHIEYQLRVVANS